MCHGSKPHTCPVLSVCQLWEPELSQRYHPLHMQIHSSFSLCSTSLVASFQTFSQSHFVLSSYQSKAPPWSLSTSVSPALNSASLTHLLLSSSSPSSAASCEAGFHVTFAGWLTLKGSTSKENRDVNSLWCPVIVLTPCSHTSTRTCVWPVCFSSRCHLREFEQELCFDVNKLLLWRNCPHMSSWTHRDPQATPLWLP